ncbi:serine hydrolase [Rugosimonospora acidiphila]|uniref:Serine hydrolase n=1 Tax=Rugosimonospora acidiphila TaxID=556531 RepID=A0ABP9RT63_9ACTN
MLKKIATGVLAVSMGLGIAAPAHAETPSAATGTPVDLSGIGSLIDATVTGQLAQDRIPGAAVVVVQNGTQVFAKGYGVADVKTGTPVDADTTEFFTGSVAKLFTATAVTQLIKQGRLDPAADVNRYLTTFKIRDTYPGHPVTAEDLLTHTAGFDDNPVGADVANPADVPQLGAYLAAHQPPRVRPPGTATAYDNYGVALAGYLVETVSGEPFAQYVREHELAPLHMDATTFAQPHPPAIQAQLAHGYRPEGNAQTEENGQYGPWSPTGAGTVATAADLSRFMVAELGDDPRLGAGVAALTQQQHFTNTSRLPGMGYLFEQRPRNGHPLLFKDGDVPGFHSNLALLPDQGIGIYVVYNGDGRDGVASWDGKALIDDIVDRYLPDIRPRPATVADPNAAAYAGSYAPDRTSHTSVTKAAALVDAATVSVNADGTLTTTGLSQNPDATAQHWTPIGKGEFLEQGGQDRIVFDGKGNLFTTIDPTIDYNKLPWYLVPALQQSLLYGGVAVLLLGFLAFSVIAATRRLRKRPAHPRAARAARLVAWTTGALSTLFTIGFVTMTADGNAFNRTIILGSASLTALLALNTAATATTLAMLAGAVAAWYKSWWTRTGRIGYSILTIAALGYLLVALTYNLVGTSFA